MFRWLFGVNEEEAADMPLWERNMLARAANRWLPMILGGEADEASAGGAMSVEDARAKGIIDG